MCTVSMLLYLELLLFFLNYFFLTLYQRVCSMYSTSGIGYWYINATELYGIYVRESLQGSLLFWIGQLGDEFV